MVSFAGNVTFPKAGSLRDAALRVPPDGLLVETDAPFLSPQAVRGTPNQPANVVDTAKAIAVERRGSVRGASRRRSTGTPAALFGW